MNLPTGRSGLQCTTVKEERDGAIQRGKGRKWRGGVIRGKRVCGERGAELWPDIPVRVACVCERDTKQEASAGLHTGPQLDDEEDNMNHIHSSYCVLNVVQLDNSFV